MCTIFAGASCYAQSSDNAACIDVPVSVTGNTQEVTVNNLTPAFTKDQSYVYYHRRGHRKVTIAPEFADVPDPRASRPILISTVKNAQGAPSQAYTVKLNSPDDRARACPDSTLNLQANLTVEQDNEYTGNYPTASDKKNYKLVSRRTYRRTERKMRNAERKEERVARLTGTSVRTSTSPM
jgi:hypothetical protein